MKRLLLLVCALLLAGCGMYVIDKGGVRGFWVGPPPPPDTVWITPAPMPRCVPMPGIIDDTLFNWWGKYPLYNDTVIRNGWWMP